MMNDLQYEFIKSLLGKIKDTVNGRVKYRYFQQLDAIIFTVEFKNFRFEFPVKDLQNTIHSGASTNDIVERFKQEYRAAVLNAFFKK